MTIPGQRANGTHPDSTPDDDTGGPETPPGTDWLTAPPESPGGGVAAVAALWIGGPIAILVSVAIGSALVAGSLKVIRWSWDTIGQALS